MTVSGARTHLWAEEGEPWLSLHDIFEPVDGGRILWASERSATYIYGCTGPNGRPESLTGGDWVR